MSPSATPKPFVAAHMFLWDDHAKGESWDKIPEVWKNFRFDAADVLFISPFIVTPSGGFGIGTADYKEPTQGSLQKRFEWVVANARAKNPRIRLNAMQWYGNDNDGMGWKILKEAPAIATYTDSVASFFKQYSTKTLVSDDGKTVSARIDGFDADYENLDDGSLGLVVPEAPAILTQIHNKLKAIDASFTVSVTAAKLMYLKDLAPVLDYVNMQNYDGGRWARPKDYLDAITGLQPGQLVYGVSAEKTQANFIYGQGLAAQEDPHHAKQEHTIDAVISNYKEGYQGSPYAGVFIWRLNSDNAIYENMVQVTVYNLVHRLNPKLPHTPDPKAIRDGWFWGGRDDAGRAKKPFDVWPQ